MNPSHFQAWVTCRSLYNLKQDYNRDNDGRAMVQEEKGVINCNVMSRIIIRMALNCKGKAKYKT